MNAFKSYGGLFASLGSTPGSSTNRQKPPADRVSSIKPRATPNPNKSTTAIDAEFLRHKMIRHPNPDNALYNSDTCNHSAIPYPQACRNIWS
jgi:hypothetical protein